MDVESAATTETSRFIVTMSDSFPMRHCMTLYLKGYQNYDMSKLKHLNSLNKNSAFNFDLSYF